MISFNQEKKIFKLDTNDSSYIFYINQEGYLIHLYYGAHVSDNDLRNLLPSLGGSFTANVEGTGYSLESLLCEYPANGCGDCRMTAVSFRGEAGTSATDIKYVSHKIFDGKSKLEGLPSTYSVDGDRCETLEITTTDTLLGVKVILSYSVFPEYDAVTRSVKVENIGCNRLNIERIMSAVYDFNSMDYDLINLWGCWARERQCVRRPLEHGLQGVSSKRGSSSHNHNPFVALAAHDATEESGDVYGFSFVYSGNFVMMSEVDYMENTRLVCGINPEDFGWILEPSESFTAPETVSVFSKDGIGKMSRQFHKLYRYNLCRGPWKTKVRPILVNNWEATYFDFTDDKLVDIARSAADLGIEMLVMDDGWFGHRNDDCSSLGDWFVNEEKLHGGLASLVKRVNDLGVKFGIWFEPEMISPDSDLYREHPDWCLHIEGRDKSISRSQYVLDMTRKDVRDNIFEQMSKVLSSANIEYVKWDFNRNLSEVGSAALPSERQKEVYHRFVLGVYDLLERLLDAFPNLLLEGCSGGGGRFDAGMLYYSPQIWTSDNTDAIDRCFIQHGTSIVYPTSAMSAHVSAIPNHQTGRIAPLKTRGNVAMAGSFGYELDLTKLNDDEKDMVRKQIENYHKYAPLMHNGDYYRLIDPNKAMTHCAWEYVSEDRREALVTLAIIRGQIFKQYFVKLRGLNPDMKYEVEYPDGKTDIFHGDTLMNAGLNLSARYPDYDTVVVHLKETK